MTRRPSLWFWVSLLIPVLILVSMTILPLSALYGGEQVTLETVPVDPRDLFYGDYVNLRLAIEEVDPSKIEPALLNESEGTSLNGIPVYVSLQKNGEVYDVLKVTREKPSHSPYLKGKLIIKKGFLSNNHSYEVDYQLDRYYVQEGTGKKLEELAREGKLLVDVKVRGGYGVIVSVRPAS